jgi:ribosomal protein L34
MYLSQGSVTHKLQQRTHSRSTLASLLRSGPSGSSALPPGGHTTSSTSQLPILKESLKRQGDEDSVQDTSGDRPDSAGAGTSGGARTPSQDDASGATASGSNTPEQQQPGDEIRPADFAALVGPAAEAPKQEAHGSEGADTGDSLSSAASAQAIVTADTTSPIALAPPLPAIRTTVAASRLSGATSLGGAKPSGIPLHVLVTAGVTSPTHVQGEGDGAAGGGGGVSTSRSPSLALGRALSRTVSSLQNVSRTVAAVGRASFTRRPKPPGWHRRMATAGGRGVVSCRVHKPPYSFGAHLPSKLDAPIVTAIIMTCMTPSCPLKYSCPPALLDNASPGCRCCHAHEFSSKAQGELDGLQVRGATPCLTSQCHLCRPVVCVTMP